MAKYFKKCLLVKEGVCVLGSTVGGRLRRGMHMPLRHLVKNYQYVKAVTDVHSLYGEGGPKLKNKSPFEAHRRNSRPAGHQVKNVYVNRHD
jgi:hypothetical protein